MARRSDPRDTVAAVLSGLFLVTFIGLFVWMLMLTWTDPGKLPRFTRTDTFTHVTTTIMGLVGGIAAGRMGNRSRHRGLQSTLGWLYLIAYFVVGFAALMTLVVNSTNNKIDDAPEAVQ